MGLQRYRNWKIRVCGKNSVLLHLKTLKPTFWITKDQLKIEILRDGKILLDSDNGVHCTP